MADVLPGDNRPAVYYEVDADNRGWWVIRASALGGCLYELVAAGQEYEPAPLPAFLLRAFKEGHDKEHEAIEWLEKQGWRTISMQREGELIIREPGEKVNGIKVRFHPDMIGVPPGYFLEEDNAEVVEVKWLSHDNFIKALRNSVASIVGEYNWQISCMMHALDLPGRWVFGNKGYAPDDAGVKPHCEDEGRIEIEPVPSPPISLADIREKAIAVVESVEGDPLLETPLRCTDTAHFPCRYLALGPREASPGEGEQPNQLTLTDAAATQVDKLVRDYLYYKGQEEESKKQKERVKAAIIDAAGGKDTDVKKLITDKWEVPIVHGTSPGGYDWAKMPKELRDRVAQFKKKGTATRFPRDIRRRD